MITVLSEISVALCPYPCPSCYRSEDSAVRFSAPPDATLVAGAVVERVAPLAEEQARCEVLAEESAPSLADSHSGAEAVPAESPADASVAVAGRSESPEAESRASYSDYLAAVPEQFLADLPLEGAEPLPVVRIGCYPAEQDDCCQAALNGCPAHSVVALPHSVAAQRLDDCSPVPDCYPA